MKTDREVLQEVHKILEDSPELNMRNYDESEVELLDSAATEAYLILHHHLNG